LTGPPEEVVPEQKQYHSKEKKFFLFFVCTAGFLVYCGTVQNLHKSVFWPLEFFKPLSKASFV
jgi:hypothetical protein